MDRETCVPAATHRPLSARRSFLQAGCLTAFGAAAFNLNLPDLLAARTIGRVSAGGGRAKSCILLFATGYRLLGATVANHLADHPTDACDDSWRS